MSGAEQRQVVGCSSFLKKRTKKLLRIAAHSIREGRSRDNQKFFASFFQKRSSFFPLYPAAGRHHVG
jgi:hypothetical protein